MFLSLSENYKNGKDYRISLFLSFRRYRFNRYYRLNRYNLFNKGIILLLFLCFLQVEFKAQDLRSTYPVQVTAFINPPYSLRLEDYCNTATTKLSVSLLNRDLQKTIIDAKLHFSIKASNGIQLETKDYNYYPTLRLQAGTPYLLSQNDLYPYLQLENLETQGVISNGQFPEGMIEICIHVIEIQTGKIVSQNSCARAWITLNRPPLLNLPANNTRFPFREPQNILFQWTPRHQGLNNVEYEFVLKEIRDENTASETAFGYSQEIYSTTVQSTGLAYTAMMPPLMENQRYAWQVRVVAREGIEELSIFENNGYSEIHSFDIIRECRAPGNVRHRQESASFIIEWTPEPEATTVLSYRTKDQGEWKTIRGEQEYTALFDLAPGIEYEYKAGTVCSDGTIAYSETQTVVLEDWKKKFEIACGKIPAFEKSNFQPLETLRPGETFTAGDFPVTVTSVSGSNGVFSGKGYTSLPLFGFVKIAVQFNNVKINIDKQLADGSIETSYDKEEKLIGDLDRIWHGGDETGYTKTGAVVNNIKADFDIPNDANVRYDDGKLIFKDKIGTEIGTVTIPEKDRIIFESGERYTYTVEDKDGDVFVITGDKDGTSTVENIGKRENPLPAGSFSETEISDKKAVVEFIQGEDAVYAFDTWKDYYKTVSLIVNKNKYEFIGTYPVSCKLIPSGKSDYVGFKINKVDKNLKEDSIIFKTKTGYTIKPQNGQLHIPGGNPNDAQDLYALYPDGTGGYLTLGKLKIFSYPEKSFNVVLVPVNENNVDVHGIERDLNYIYNKVGIHWNITTDSIFSYPDTDLYSEGSGLFSQYTGEMKTMNAAYRDSRGNLDKNTAYLFLLKHGSIKGQLITGDMPRGKQFGYIFTEGGENLSLNIAHELGHGVFRLQHTFDGEYGSVAKSLQGQTDNLMDYSSGTHLAKWQWDEIHDPALLVNPFEGDEDGMRKDESQRSQITRFIYAMKDVLQNQIQFSKSNVFRTDDINLLNSKKDFSIKADHIFYDELPVNYFEEVELKLFFNAKNRQNNSIDELFFIRNINKVTYRSWYIESLDAIIVFTFKQEKDIYKFEEFLDEKDVLMPPNSSTRKAFFIHGTASDGERWLEHPLTEKVLLCIANTDKYDDQFSWETYSDNYLNDVVSRNKAAQMLVNHVINNSQGVNEIVLIGHSHGGNVSLQAVNQLVNKGKTVYVITIATPAYNNATVKVHPNHDLQNVELVETTKSAHVYKNPENPVNVNVTQHLHLWNRKDKVAGEIALGSDDFYKSTRITENIEIPTEGEYSTVRDVISMISFKFNAHGFDANRPQLIYQMLLQGKIQPIQ